MALLRSAEPSLAHGFKYFVIGVASDDTRTAAYSTGSNGSMTELRSSLATVGHYLPVVVLNCPP